MVAERLPIDRRTIRLDYGENALDAPDLVRESLFESFARQHLTPAELDPSPEVAALLEERFELPDVRRRGGRIVCGLGVADLFAALLRGGGIGAGGGGTVLFPAGSYGFFVAAVQLFGGRAVVVETARDERFKLTPAGLEAALDRHGEGAGTGGPAWLFLNGPIVNPTGAIYSRDEIAALLAVAAARGVPVILDTIFSGLELPTPAGGPRSTRPRWDLGPILGETGADAVVLGGISKELAAGGIRFGWAAATSPALGAALEAGGPTPCHGTIRFAVKRMLGRLGAAGRPTGADPAAEQLAAQRALLARRAGRLTRELEACGWEVLPPAGGLFLVARPGAYLGRSLEIEPTPETGGERRTFTLDGQTIADALFWSERLMINGSTWTGIPEWCRFVFAVEEEELEEGLRRLRSFARRVGVVPTAS
jgi:methionine S-methyltransferase